MRRFLSSAVWLAAFAGCGDLRAPRVTWDQLDEQALNSQFASPTGGVTEVLLKQLVASSLEDEVRYASKALGQVIGTVTGSGTGSGAADGSTTGTLQAALTITSSDAYIRASCPGPDTGNPDVTFGHGQVRFDAPGITTKKASLQDGDVLLTFTDCVSGKVTFKGKSAAYYDTTRGLIADLSLELVTVGAAAGEYQQSMRFYGQHVDLLVETPGGTYVVDVGQIPSKITVTGKDATVTCSLNGSKATCEFNGKSVSFDVKEFQKGAGA
jgi:hypothetical protein